MKHTIFTGTLLLITTTVCLAQSDLIYPWITNSSQFKGTLTLNNLNDAAVEVTLTATRPDGVEPNQQTVVLNLGPLEQITADAGSIFDQMGEGSAYMVRLKSDASNITGGFVNSGTQSLSGLSPSQANVVSASEANNTLLFNYMSITDNGFSAPVIINLGESDVEVSLHVYQNGDRVGQPTTISVPAQHPFAATAGSLFPEVTGDIYMVAESTAPMLGVVFIFNSDLEPSMANAVPISKVPEKSSDGGVSFVSQIVPIITANCGTGSCHLNGSRKGNLDLEPDVAYGNLVGVEADAVFGLRVDPGNLETSYFYQKLLPLGVGNFIGDQMPPGSRPKIEGSDLETIKMWIQEGALDN